MAFDDADEEGTDERSKAVTDSASDAINSRGGESGTSVTPGSKTQVRVRQSQSAELLVGGFVNSYHERYFPKRDWTNELETWQQHKGALRLTGAGMRQTHTRTAAAIPRSGRAAAETKSGDVTRGDHRRDTGAGIQTSRGCSTVHS